MTERLYAILGVTPDATDEQITENYRALKRKYSEDRFLEGEAGNEASRKLDELETAYVDLMSERREQRRSESGDDAFAEINRLIKDDKIHEAQLELDQFNERSAEWHYFQSAVYFRKNWMNESRKQMEIAMEMEPNNEKYRNGYQKIQDKMNGNSAKNANRSGPQNEGDHPDNFNEASHSNPDMDQMGGNGLMQCCYTCACMSCISNCCCR